MYKVKVSVTQDDGTEVRVVESVESSEITQDGRTLMVAAAAVRLVNRLAELGAID